MINDLKQFHLFADYNPSTEDNDITLIRLAGNVVFTDYIMPACLPSSMDDDVANETACWITGWGDTLQGGIL